MILKQETTDGHLIMNGSIISFPSWSLHHLHQKVILGTTVKHLMEEKHGQKTLEKSYTVLISSYTIREVSTKETYSIQLIYYLKLVVFSLHYQ